MERPQDRPTIDDLLTKGHWRTKNANHHTDGPPSPVSRYPPVRPSVYHESPRPSSSHRIPSSHRVPTRRTNYPPRPTCEDEVLALAKEVPPRNAKSEPTIEIPERGIIDQQPIILEAHVSAIDAATLQSHFEKEAAEDKKGERRFVLVPGAGTNTPTKNDDEERKARRAAANKSSKESTREQPSRKLSPPSLERRRSRQDLPTLQTKLAPQAPPFHRSNSAYAFTPQKETPRNTRAPSADYARSPDARVPPPGHSREHFNAKPPPQPPRPLNDATNRLDTPVVEKRRSGGYSSSRPNTPGSDGHSSENHGRVVDRERTPKAQASENVSARDRHPSNQSSTQYESRHSDGRGSSRASSSHSNAVYYVSSDDDLASSDSDTGKTKRRQHQYKNKSLHPDGGRDSHHRSGSKSSNSSHDHRPHSRHASPLSSPKVSPSQLPPAGPRDSLRASTFPTSRDARNQGPRPVSPFAPVDIPQSASLKPTQEPGRSSRRPSPASSPQNSFSASTATLPVPIPTRINLQSPGHSEHPPSIPHYDEDITPKAQTGKEKPFWQPPHFEPGAQTQYLEKPVGSYRRYSQDIEKGTISPLPACPRAIPVRGYTDWLGIPNVPGFNMCPSCFQAAVLPTEFRSHFSAAPIRSPNDLVTCDFGSQPWYRIAWLLTLKERRKDLKFLQRIAEVHAHASPCLGKHEAIRRWYSVIDDTTDQPVRNFDVCAACVKCIETLLPDLRGTFVRIDHHGPVDLARVCDMRFDSKRFVHYFDALEIMADSETDPRLGPDTRDFVELAKNYASINECAGHLTIRDTKWYVITQLPEFTVCDECFDEVVKPGLDKRKAIPMMFSKKIVRGDMSCQLYSDRMREIFEDCVAKDDYLRLATKARERKNKELEHRKGVESAKRRGTGSTTVKTEIERLDREWRRWE